MGFNLEAFIFIGWFIVGFLDFLGTRNVGKAEGSWNFWVAGLSFITIVIGPLNFILSMLIFNSSNKRIYFGLDNPNQTD